MTALMLTSDERSLNDGLESSPPAIRRGDVHWVDLPDIQDGLRGGMHPAIIWSADRYCEHPKASVIRVVPVTSLKPNCKVRDDQVLILPPNGVYRPSVVRTNLTGPVDRKRIHDRMGQVDADTLRRIERCLLKVDGMEHLAGA